MFIRYVLIRDALLENFQVENRADQLATSKGLALLIYIS